MVEQLRSGGVIEALHVQRAGYPCRTAVGDGGRLGGTGVEGGREGERVDLLADRAWRLELRGLRVSGT